jgi:hypothetical protein
LQHTTGWPKILKRKTKEGDAKGDISKNQKIASLLEARTLAYG